MRIILLAFCCLALAAQQAREKIDYCGLGSHHECNCVRRTQAVHEKFIDNCERSSLRPDGSKDDKAFNQCMQGMPAHCDTADQHAISGEAETDPAMKRSIVDGLRSQRNAKGLVDLARKETDPAMKREIVSRLSNMKSKESADYLMELLK